MRKRQKQTHASTHVDAPPSDPIGESVPGPEYEALAEVLMRLRNIPDGLGETVLSSEEAAQIRRCGFQARAGCTWRCPPLPDELVRWNPLLHHLSDAIDPLSRFSPWHPRRAASRRIADIYPLMRIERKVIEHVRRPPYRLPRRRLQQKMWRLPASFFNHMLNRMIAEDRITQQDGWLYPYSRAEFERVHQSQNCPAQPVTRSAVRRQDLSRKG
ncbi:MAG TPA: DNA/RNA-binding winged helix domain-containing protein [Bryobacteraceae bacterium]|nr:DNA/RNA-binding winged helix domain-containing protein [Bryobacteraceae bacterium]